MKDSNETLLKRIEEALKVSHTSIMIFRTLMFTSIVLMTTAHTGTEFKIEFLGITLDKENGIEILLFLMFLALCRSLIMRLYVTKLEDLGSLKDWNQSDIILTRPPSMSSFTELFIPKNSLLRRKFMFYFGILGGLFLTVRIGIIQICPDLKCPVLSCISWPKSWIVVTIINIALAIFAIRVFSKLISKANST